MAPEHNTINEPQTRMTTARDFLAEIIEHKRRELAGLDALYRALPLELPFEADQALLYFLVHR